MKLWFGAWTIGVPVLAIIAAEPSRTTLLDWRGVLLVAVIAVVSPVLGFFLGVFAGSVLLPPVYALRERLNGGPLKAGDLVQILVGRHRGEITAVVSAWQGRSYRVHLDDDSERKFQDIFGADQLIKEKDAGPADARERRIRVD